MSITERHERPYIVGLTGGIGSGKSTVSRLFAEKGVEVIDADEVSRNLVTPESPALASLTAHFGKTLLNSDGSLQRARLRSLIFNDKVAKAWVEDLLHPLIREAIAEQISKSPSPWLLLSAPLLLESKAYDDYVDRLLVVDVPEQTQLTRTTARDKISGTEVTKIMLTQLARADRLAAADDIIDNSGDMNNLEQQVRKLQKQYEEAAHVRHQAG